MVKAGGAGGTMSKCEGHCEKRAPLGEIILTTCILLLWTMWVRYCQAVNVPLKTEFVLKCELR